MTHKQVVLILILFIALPKWCLAEGTRELQPYSGSGIMLRVNYDSDTLSTDGGPFATPNAPNDSYRLWVSIANASEKILFGFRKNTSSDVIYLTIFNSNHQQVYPASGTFTLPNSGAGYISSYAQAVAGPATINSSGYTPVEFTPGAAGNYYFEFSWTSGTGHKYLLYSDITVVNSSNVEKKGRLWSKNWQMETSATTVGFYGTMFPYTDDQITTKIEFNGMAPGRFTVACNPTGCSNTGNFLTDRMSVTGNHTYPAYKIFVNNPDETLFPTGIVGGVNSVNINNPCDGTVEIELNVSKKGIADILFNINPLPGIQSEDVVFNATVYSGNSTTITWDGLNGLGVPVANGTTFDIEITYVNGLTHLPLYDVEHSSSSWDGFIVNLIRPTGDKPKVYWDDRNLLSTSYNLDGCIDPAGCHSWGTMGDMNTVNTWWFAISTVLVPIPIQYKRSDEIWQTNVICQGDSANVFGNWVKLPGVYSQTSTNFMGCDSTTNITVMVKARPVIELGPDQLLCQGESTTLGHAVTGVTNYVWNTVPPQATPLATTPTLTVNSTATYKVQITASNGCTNTDQVHVTAATFIGKNRIKHN